MRGFSILIFGVLAQSCRFDREASGSKGQTL